MTASDDDGSHLEPVVIAAVDTKSLANICVRALKDRKFQASMAPEAGSPGNKILRFIMSAGLGGRYEVFVPAYQAEDAKAFLQSSRLLGPT